MVMSDDDVVAPIRPQALLAHLAGVVPVETRFAVHQPLDDHLDCLGLELFLGLPLHFVVVETCLRHTAAGQEEAAGEDVLIRETHARFHHEQKR